MVATVLIDAVVVAFLVFVAVRVALWRVVCSRYPHRGRYPADTIGFENGTALGWSFRGLLSVGTTDEALVFGPSIPPFRVLLPAVAVPWDRVRDEGISRRPFFRMAAYAFDNSRRLCVFEGGKQHRLIAGRMGERLLVSSASRRPNA